MTTGGVPFQRRPLSVAAGRIVLALLFVGCQRAERIEESDGLSMASQPSPQAAVRSLPDVLAAAGDVHHDELAAGETNAYRLDLVAGEAVLLEVDQGQVDVEVEIVDPVGDLLLAFDTPTGRFAPERVCAVAAASGPHSLRLTPYGEPGGYTVRLLRKAAATAGDRACFEAMRVFRAAGRLDPKAQSEAYARAATLWQMAGEPLLAAVALRESAWASRRLGPESRAIERFERALELARTVGSTYLEISVLNRLGLAHFDAGRLAAAQARLEEAESRARETHDARGLASALTNLGMLDDQRGDPYRAIERYSEALSTWREMDDSSEIAQTLLNTATAYGVLDRHDLALDLLAEALARSRQAKDLDREASVLLEIGWIHYLRGRAEDGLPALDSVVAIRRRQGDVNGRAAALDRRGTLLRSARRYEDAERSYRTSLALSLGTGSSYDAAATVANLGCLFAETGRLDEARRHLEEAARRLQAFGDGRSVSHVEYCIALTESAAGRIDAALLHVRRALEIVGGFHDLHRRSGHHFRPIWLWQDYAELEIDLLLRRYRLTHDPRTLQRIFEATDLARARTLFERVVETRAGVRSNAASSLLHSERAIQDELNRLASELAAAEAAGRAPLEAEVRRLRSELERVRASIRVADPRFEAASPRPVSVEAARELLAPGTALLSYVLADDRSQLLVLDSSRLTLHELPSKRRLETSARAFHEALQASVVNSYQWQLLASALGEVLLPKAALAPEIDRLIVVADGLLHYVPFGALRSPRDDARPAIEDFEISYVPSVSVLGSLNDRSGGWSQPVAMGVFADAVYAERDSRLAGEGNGQTGSGDGDRPSSPRTTRWPRLPSSADEARWIADAAGPSLAPGIRIGFEANKQAVLSADLTALDVIHFATHARIDETFPELSGLVLSRFDPAGRPIDPEVRLHEIHGLNLDAGLTVLSGCETALGEHVRGDGLQGFAHGFLYAGSDRVLVTLWKVHDDSTARLMAELYRKLLREDLPPASALRQAQLWLRSQPQWTEPVYWAPFVLQGLD